MLFVAWFKNQRKGQCYSKTQDKIEINILPRHFKIFDFINSKIYLKLNFHNI